MKFPPPKVDQIKKHKCYPAQVYPICFVSAWMLNKLYRASQQLPQAEADQNADDNAYV